MSRDRLALLLWEDMPDAQARGNLRQLLAATRRLAPFLDADAGSIGFAAGMVETDLGADEASSWAAMTLREWPDFQNALRIAAASNALAGRIDEAKNARVRLQRLHTGLRISPREVWGP